jgi:AAA+ ATPase superfamily predicted ATPase
MQNPFKYGNVVEAPYFTDREKELKTITENIKAGNNLVLYSPRRYGKTSLLNKVAHEIEAKGFSTIYIDFYRVNTIQDFIELYTRAVVTKIKKPLANVVKKISSLVRGAIPSLSFDASGNPVFSLSFQATTDLPQTLEDALNLPENIGGEKRWLIVFDEFQEITNLSGNRFDSQLRSVIQFHKNAVYVFSGSKHHLLLNLFNKPENAFYRFGKIIRLDKIDPVLMRLYVIERFASTKIKLPEVVADYIITQSDNIPNYVQYLAAEVWQNSLEMKEDPSIGTVNLATLNMLSNLQDYFLQIWEKLSNYQKQVLAALISDNSNLFTKEFQSKYHLTSMSGTQRAIDKLIELELVYKEDQKYEFADPFLKRYIELRILA